jgi:hypothetical protein
LFEIRGCSDCALAQAVNRRSLSSRKSRLDFTTDREGFAVDNRTDFSRGFRLSLPITTPPLSAKATYLSSVAGTLAVH